MSPQSAFLDIQPYSVSLFFGANTFIISPLLFLVATFRFIISAIFPKLNTQHLNDNCAIHDSKFHQQFNLLFTSYFSHPSIFGPLLAMTT